MKMRSSILVAVICFLGIHLAQAQTETISWKEQDAYFAKAVQDLAATGTAIAIVKDGKVVFQNAYGYADAAAKTPLTTKHIFNIASCSKAFTAALMAQQVEAERLKWDDKVIQYLPEFRLADPYIGQHMTIRDLFCHRSGMETFEGDLLWYGTDLTDTEILKKMEFLSIDHNFRYEFGYQNNMYMVAGLILEKVTGKTWTQLLSNQLLQPLAMNATSPSNDELKAQALLAKPHINQKVIQRHDFNGTKPAAAMQSTVEDIALWMQMLLNKGMNGDKRLLEEKSLWEMWQAHTPQPVSPNTEKNGTHFMAYGLGWKVYDYFGKKVVEHDGGMPGFISKVVLVPEENMGIVILNNGFNFFVNSVMRNQVLDLYIKGAPTQPWLEKYSNYRKNYEKGTEEANAKRLASQIPNTTPSLPLNGYASTYQDKAYGEAVVEMKEGALHLTLMPAKTLFQGTLTHWHHNTYRWDHQDPFLTYGLVTFEMDAQGQVSGFSIDLPNDDFHFHKLHFSK